MKTNQSIAAFPLSLAVLPGELIPLHLFEERYRQLLADVEHASNEFAIIYSAHGQLADVATIVSIESVANRYENGTSDIIIKGERIIKVTDFTHKLEDRLYPGVFYTDLMNYDTVEDATYASFFAYQDRKGSTKLVPKNIYDLALKINLTQDQQLKLITADTAAAKNKIVRSALQFEDKIHHQIELLNGNYHLN